MTDAPVDKAPLLSHLIELRQRLVIAVVTILVMFIGCYTISEHIFGFLVQPLRDIIGPDAKMIYTSLQEAFFTYLKVAFFSGLFLALPMVFTQIWLFVAPGLYQHEKRTILPFLLLTPVLFFTGGALAYLFVFPLAFKFFLGFVTPTIEALPSLKEYLNLVIKLIFAFGIAFEMPLGLLLMVKTGLITTAGLVKKRKYSIVIAFVAAAILTPPDPFTQVFLALPLLTMYEIAIIGGRMIEKKREAHKLEEAAEDAARLKKDAE
ncbi:MAG: twin-arginine translocase subunit TatC [Magnetococcales bacterium]|nr:twin-arginine translocase subunit TatC [Magnetococcales bacterium]